MPYFFTAMKISIAAALVGTIVGELPTGAVRGLGARMLSGSYYGQTIQIWSALFAAAILAAALVGRRRSDRTGDAQADGDAGMIARAPLARLLARGLAVQHLARQVALGRHALGAVSSCRRCSA